MGWTAVGLLVLHLAGLAWLGAGVLVDGTRELTTGEWAPGVGIVLRADALGVTFAFFSSFVLLVALLYELASGAMSRTFAALVLFQTAGLTGLFLTGDVFNFFVFFELSLIAGYVLATHGEGPRQLSSAFIFAVVNLLGSFVFLLAVASIYHVTGTLEMLTVADRLAVVEPTSVILIAISVFVAFGVKLGLFPFHFWIPPLYTGARPAVAAILAGAVANIGAYGFLRFGAIVLPAELELGAGVLIVLGVLSILYGSAQALSRRTTTEVIAYSAIGQVGYILIALAVGGPVGYTAAVVYSLVNSFNKVVLFLAAGARGRFVGAAFAVGALSVVGLPPTTGFIAKVELFLAGLEADRSALLVGLIVLGSLLSFVYMFQVYQHVYWRGGGGEGDPSSRGARLIVLAFALLIVLAGIWPEPLLWISERAAEVLLEEAGP
ncbi:MAG TPA: proton-conducting transporter membrane subunit [Gaiellaceae bacterium]|nr:proton-conducting transporter membrane subunit [Gaiellaceae bacterium]